MADERVFACVPRHVQDIVVGNPIDHSKKDSRSIRRLQQVPADGGVLNVRQISRFQDRRRFASAQSHGGRRHQAQLLHGANPLS